MNQAQQQYNTTRTENSKTDSEETNSKEICPECGSQTHLDKQERICPNCGLVVNKQMIDHGPEWRAFDQNEREQKKRTGAPATEMKHDKGLSTTISWQNKDANGNTLSMRKRQQMGRLRKWDERFRTKNSRERGMKFAFGEIKRMGSALGVSKSVREIASVVYRQITEHDELRGRSIEATATACLYIGCRQDGLPKTPAEIANVSRIGSKEFKRAYRHYVRVLDLPMEPVDPEEYLPSFISQLETSNALETTARDIIEISTEKGLLSGKSPSCFAAAAIYTAGVLTNEKITQKEIAAVTNTSKVTIRNRYKEQLEIAHEHLE